MASFFDHLEQKFYGELLGKEKRSDIFSTLDVWANLIEAAKDDKRIVGCYLKIEKVGNHFKITQVMSDAKMKYITVKGEFVLARVCEAYDLDDNLYAVFQTRKLTYLTLETLTIKTQADEGIEEDD